MYNAKVSQNKGQGVPRGALIRHFGPAAPELPYKSKNFQDSKWKNGKKIFSSIQKNFFLEL